MLCNASSDGVRDDSPAQLMGGSWEYHGTGLSFGRILQTLVGKQFLQMPSGILWCAGTRFQVVRHTTDNSTFIVRHNTDRICSSGASTQREALWDHCVFGSSKKATSELGAHMSCAVLRLSMTGGGTQRGAYGYAPPSCRRQLSAVYGQLAKMSKTLRPSRSTCEQGRR